MIPYWLFKQQLRILAFRDSIYLNNPKAACSSIKLMIMNQENAAGNTNIDVSCGKVIHNRNLPVWCFSLQDFLRAQKFVFSFVRNPFSRVLSAYLDKVRPRAAKNGYFREACGLPKNIDINFETFLKSICEQDDLQNDPHWRSQTTNLLYGKIPIHFIGNVETFEYDITYLSSLEKFRNVKNIQWGYHATHAIQKLNYYLSEEAISYIIYKYEMDFINFHYSFDYRWQRPLYNTRPTPGDPNFLQKMKDLLTK